MVASFRRRWMAGLFSVMVLSGLAACSGDGSGVSPLTSPDSPGSEADLQPGSEASLESSETSSGSGSGDSNRLEARLNPVIAVDASGQARLENPAGTANDRFDSEVEIAKADFRRLGIDAADGFQDEQVILVVRRGTTQVFITRLRFSENRATDITFETDIRGPAAPELRAGDVAGVRVNGVNTLRGVFQRD